MNAFALTAIVVGALVALGSLLFAIWQANLLFWGIVRLLMIWRYGRVGALRPPLNRNQANSLWYRWRHAMWRIDDWLFHRTSLRDEWFERMRGCQQ